MASEEPLQQVLERFLHYLDSERRLSSHTLNNYRRDLVRLRDWCQEQDG